MLWTIDFLVLQEDTVALAGAHEVVVTRARGEAAANRGAWLLTLLTALKTKYNELQMSVQQIQAENRTGTCDGESVLPAVFP